MFLLYAVVIGLALVGGGVALSIVPVSIVPVSITPVSITPASIAPSVLASINCEIRPAIPPASFVVASTSARRNGTVAMTTTVPKTGRSSRSDSRSCRLRAAQLDRVRAMTVTE